MWQDKKHSMGQRAVIHPEDVRIKNVSILNNFHRAQTERDAKKHKRKQSNNTLKTLYS